MTIKTKSTLRRVVSLSAFTVLIAAVTMAFADAPKKQNELHYEEFEPMQITASNPTTRLAKATNRAVPNKAKSTPPKTSSKKELTGTLNLNTANATDLTKLPGVGPKKAERIVNWRATHGKFSRVVDLRRVKGFGAKSVKKLLPYLSIKGSNTLQ